MRAALAATLLSATIGATAPAPAAALTQVEPSGADEFQLVARSVPADTAKLTTPAPSPSSPATTSNAVPRESSTWATVGFYVLFGIWMLACAAIVTWIAVARRRDSS